MASIQGPADCTRTQACCVPPHVVAVIIYTEASSIVLNGPQGPDCIEVLESQSYIGPPFFEFLFWQLAV